MTPALARALARTLARTEVPPVSVPPLPAHDGRVSKTRRISSWANGVSWTLDRRQRVEGVEQ